jgi:hypothetical protein
VILLFDHPEFGLSLKGSSFRSKGEEAEAFFGIFGDEVGVVGIVEEEAKSGCRFD